MFFSGTTKHDQHKVCDIHTSSTSHASSISTKGRQLIVNKLRNDRNRDTTRRTYYNTWKNFNEFVIKLDRKPPSWEERIVLYVGYLINQKEEIKYPGFSAMLKIIPAEESSNCLTKDQDHCCLIHQSLFG